MNTITIVNSQLPSFQASDSEKEAEEAFYKAEVDRLRNELKLARADIEIYQKYVSDDTD